MNRQEEIQKIIETRNIYSEFSLPLHKQMNILNCILDKEADELEMDDYLCKCSFNVKTINDLMKIKIKECPYLIKPFIVENAINAITADSGTGKSLLALILAEKIAKGEKFFDKYETKQKKVLIIDQEMDEDLIAGRVQSIIRASLPIEFIYEQDWKIENEEHFNYLKKYIKDNDIGLLIIDTLSTIHLLNENDASEMNRVHGLFLQIIRETNCTILFLHHHRKGMAGEELSKASARGSTAIIDKSSSHLTLSGKRYSDESNKVLELTLSQEKNRRGDFVNKIKIDINYDSKENLTICEYKGETDDRGVIPELCNAIKLVLNEKSKQTKEDLAKELKGYGKFDLINEHLIFLEKDFQIKSTRKGTIGGKKIYYLEESKIFNGNLLD